MKKIMMIIAMCLMLVGCSKQTALDITKENYEKYGYNYAYDEIKEMVRSGDITGEDGAECLEFITRAEYGDVDALDHLNTSKNKEGE